MVGSRFVTTALITGASAGIGRELARLFAADGHNLLLIARRLPELQVLSVELAQRYGIQARARACDLGSSTELDALLAELGGVELEFIVNNAGYGTVGLFAERAPEREVAMVDLNVTALLRLTRAVLPQMLARGRGRILNIGSTAGFQAGPYMATYYASKAFVNSFSEALSYEVRGSGVTVTLSCPGPTSTEFANVSGLDKSALFKSGAASAASVAAGAYRAMHAGKVMMVHGFLNWLLTQIVPLSPRFAVRAITASLNRPPALTGKG